MTVGDLKVLLQHYPASYDVVIPDQQTNCADWRELDESDVCENGQQKRVYLG